ncbi:MAG: acetylxylan esterase, partial [Candidatus Omnitrophica bacterium]|nr:acetylxylan esterase [Candidatus Omnitrophota bacterium]
LYAHPEGDGPFPAILQIHGGGQTCYPSNVAFFVKHGYACLSFDWSGPRDNRPESEITMWHQDFRGEYMDPEDHEPGQNFIHHAVLASVRGIDILSQRPEVDKEKIGVQGVSWGGYLTWLVNGLEPRLKAAVPVYGIGELEKQWSGIGQSLRNRSEAFQAYWKTNYDPASFADNQHGPVLFLNATNDFFGQLDECEARLKQVQVPHRRSYGANRMHSLDPESVNAAMAWFDAHLKDVGEFPEAPVLEMGVDSKGVPVATLKVDESRPVESVRVDFARGPFHPLLKGWLSSPADRTAEGVWRVEIPVVDSAEPLSLIPQVIYEGDALLSGEVVNLVPAQEFPTARATQLTSDTLSDWDNGPSGWLLQRGTDFTHADNTRLELGEVEGHQALVYRSESPAGSIRLVTRVFADSARNKGNKKSLVLWTHDIEGITLKTNWFLRQPGALTHKASAKVGKGWVKHVFPLSELIRIEEETDQSPEGSKETLENWNDVHSLELTAQTVPEGLPAIGWMGWE